jgi:hypothetical protein
MRVPRGRDDEGDAETTSQVGGLAALALGLLALCGGSAIAQTAGSGTIRGILTDATGAAISGATVIVRNADTVIQREVTSTESGVYVAPYLQSGQYEVKASAAGMATWSRSTSFCKWA